MTHQEIERITRLEERMKAMERTQAEHTSMLREVRDTVVSARGAKWAIMALVGASGTIGALISQFMPR